MSVISVSIDTDNLSITASLDGNPVSLSSFFVDDYTFEDFDGKTRRLFSFDMTEKPTKDVNGVETQIRRSFRYDSEDASASSDELVSKDVSVSRPLLSWTNNAERLSERTEELTQAMAELLKIGKYT